MFTPFFRSGVYYDVIYGTKKNYATEAGRLRKLIQRYKKSQGKTLLDVACGTGMHLSFLRQKFRVEGLDLDSKLLLIARKRNPGARFHQGDMTSFDLGKQFDVVTCLFSAIGYVKTLRRLRRTIRCMARHLKPGGVLIVEPWLTPERFTPGLISALHVDQPRLKICRMNRTVVKGRLSFMDFHYLVGTPERIEYSTERHTLGLFTHNEYLKAFRDSELDVIHNSEGLIGRGLYIGLKSLVQAAIPNRER
jgi:SAM-dependent methyltransferase